MEFPVSKPVVEFDGPFDNKKKHSNQIKLATAQYLEMLEREEDQGIDEETQKLGELYFAKRLNSKNEFENFGLSDPLSEFQKLGDGVYFYFYFLKFWAFVFGIISIFCLFNILLNAYGNGLNSSSSVNQLLSTSLGNIRPMIFNTTITVKYLNATNFVTNSTIENDIKTQKNIFSLQIAIEIITCMILFIAYFIFRNEIRKEMKISHQVNITPNKYTIMVKFDLRWNDVTEEEFKDFFKKYGTICKVDFARKFDGCLEYLMILGKSQFKLHQLQNSGEQNEKKECKLKAKIQNATEEINKKLDDQNLEIKDLRAFRPIYGFITFDDHKVVSSIISEFRQAYKRSFFQRVCGKAAPIDPQFLLKGHTLKIIQPDNPSNLYWENMQTTKNQRNFRFFIIFLLVVLLFVLSFAINIIISAVGVGTSLNLNCGNTVYTMQSLLPNDARGVNCYCSQLGLKDLLTQTDLCHYYYIFQITEIGKSVGIAISVAVVNIGIYYIISFLVKFIGYYSKSQLIIKKILFSFILQYVNTAFVAYIIYGIFNGWSIINMLNSIIGWQYLHVQSQFVDIDRVWYPLMGEKIFFSIIITIFNPTFLDLAIFYLQKIYKQFKAKYKKNRGKYLKFVKPPTFPLEKNYVKVLSPFFIVMTFTGGIPLLYLFLFINLFCSYWIDKLIVTRLTKRPALYSRKLIVVVAKYIPAALVIHMIFAIYTLSNETIFPFFTTFYFNFNTFNDLSNSNQFFKVVFFRAYKCLPLTILTIIFTLVFICQDAIDMFVNYLEKKRKVIDFGKTYKFGTYTDNYSKISAFTLPNYNIAINPKYQNLLKLLFENFKTPELRKKNTEYGIRSLKNLDDRSQNDIENLLQQKYSNERELEKFVETKKYQKEPSLIIDKERDVKVIHLN